MAAPCVVDGSAPAPSPVAMPTAPVAEPTAPVREPAAPVAEPTAPVTEPTAPVAEPTAPVAEPTAPVDVCSNGIPGIQTGNACCLAECGGCGGTGCAQLGGGLGADNCCQSEIEDFGALCSATMTAPCIVDSVPGPAPSPVAMPTAPVIEPTAPVTEPSAPTADSTCPNAGGIPGVESPGSSACCPTSCVSCGGVGCSSRGEVADCCVSAIMTTGVACEVSGTAPCYIGDGGEAPAPTPEPVGPTPVTMEPTTEPPAAPTTQGVCSNGIPGIESANGDYCCPATCRACDGDNCYLDGLFCCGDDIEETGVLCDDSEEAPCIIDIDGGDFATYAPTGAPTGTPFDFDPTTSGGNDDSMDVDIDGDGKVDSYEHVGCYALSPTASVELEKLDGEEQMTKMLCFEACAAESADYFALFKGSVCACGDEGGYLTMPMEMGICDTPCSGDVTATCGGYYDYDLYELMESDFVTFAPTSSPVVPAPTDGTGHPY
ncbi:unnamed protein product [Ectocarpus sp. 12 AP-2014]